MTTDRRLWEAAGEQPQALTPQQADRRLWEARRVFPYLTEEQFKLISGITDLQTLEDLLNQWMGMGIISYAQASDMGAWFGTPIYDRQVSEQRAEVLEQERSLREGQTAEALLAGMKGKPREEEEAWKLPAMPEVSGLLEPYFDAATPYGEGTKLESFIKGRIAKEALGAYEKTKQARAEWHRRMHPKPEDIPVTFEEEEGRLTGEAQRWSAVAEAAPSSTIAGETYYGPGGLKGMAEGAYRRAQTQLETLASRPEDYVSEAWRPEPLPQFEEDPLKVALRKLGVQDYRAAYYRRPGTGLVSRLTPAARW